MPEQQVSEIEAARPCATAPSWPYRVGLAFAVVGAAGFLFAPFSGVVYIALPGVALATWFAFANRCPFRFGLAASVAAFVAGFVTGASGLAFALASSGGDSFAAQEVSFLVVVAGLWALPMLGLVVGGVSLVGAHFRPGTRRPSQVHEDGLGWA